MFDFEDRDRIIQMMNAKHPEAYVVPLYVRIYNDRFAMTELDTIQQFNPSAFTVGFGAMMSIFDKHAFPKDHVWDFNCKTSFSRFDVETNIDTRYFIFESRAPFDGKHPLFDQLEYYYQQLFEYVRSHTEQARRDLIQQQMMNS